MTAQQVAVLLLLPISTVMDYARRGVLPSIKLGKHRRCPLPGQGSDRGSGAPVALVMRELGQQRAGGAVRVYQHDGAAFVCGPAYFAAYIRLVCVYEQ
jgi:hypothetical protein